MNAITVQRWIDEFLETARQQWLFRIVAVGAPVGALLAASAATGRWWLPGLFLVTMLAVASAVRSDTHTALVVIGLIVWRWLVAVDDVTTPWLPVASVCLLVYHAAIALSATIPIGGEVAATIVNRWLQRTSLGAAVAVGMWALVVIVDRRESAGNGLLTGLALAIVAGTTFVIRGRSLDQPR